MTKTSAKLACTASGMGFEEWKRRPVYKAQCFTFDIARKLCGIHLSKGQGLATILGAPDSAQGLQHFRCLPQYRTTDASRLRSLVAHQVKALRRRDPQAI